MDKMLPIWRARALLQPSGHWKPGCAFSAHLLAYAPKSSAHAPAPTHLFLELGSLIPLFPIAPALLGCLCRHLHAQLRGKGGR